MGDATKQVLVTGGAGFIGSHLVDRLVLTGHRVVVLDSFEPQVHASSFGYRNPEAQYIEGSVLDRTLIASALEEIDAVVHLAAAGVGQSMYEIARYVDENCRGTAVLLEAVVEKEYKVSTLVVASSMSIYGEGQYACDTCGSDDTEVIRALEALRARRWEPICVRCGSVVRPVLTRVSKWLQPESVYAITKRDQEELSLTFGRAYGVRTVALRFFNVYGPRQSLANPYSGVAAVFASRLLSGRGPLVFEDGLQTRDFVHVSDIVRSIELALQTEEVRDVALNIGTGVPTTVLEVASVLAKHLEVDLRPEVLNRFRHGDVRHCLRRYISRA